MDWISLQSKDSQESLQHHANDPRDSQTPLDQLLPGSYLFYHLWSQNLPAPLGKPLPNLAEPPLIHLPTGRGGGWKRGGQGGTDLSAAAFLGFCFFFQSLLNSKNKTVLLSFSVLLWKVLDFPGSGTDLKKKKK